MGDGDKETGHTLYVCMVTLWLHREFEFEARLGYMRLREGESTVAHTPAMPALGGMDVRGHPALHSKGLFCTAQ